MGLDVCSFADLIAKMTCSGRVCISPRASLILHIPADLLQADERGSSLNTHILSSTSHSNHNLPKFQHLPLWEPWNIYTPGLDIWMTFQIWLRWTPHRLLSGPCFVSNAGLYLVDVGI